MPPRHARASVPSGGSPPFPRTHRICIQRERNAWADGAAIRRPTFLGIRQSRHCCASPFVPSPPNPGWRGLLHHSARATQRLAQPRHRTAQSEDTPYHAPECNRLDTDTKNSPSDPRRMSLSQRQESPNLLPFTETYKKHHAATSQPVQAP